MEEFQKTCLFPAIYQGKGPRQREQREANEAEVARWQPQQGENQQATPGSRS